jgi:3-hydroxyacyl-CoA dehydrogenase
LQTASPSHVKSFGVIGAGQMGTGIAIVAAQQMQAKVVLIDAKQDQLNKSIKFVGETPHLIKHDTFFTTSRLSLPFATSPIHSSASYYHLMI